MLVFRLGVFTLFVLISHIALPVFNDGKDFYVFASWNMFTRAFIDESYDIELGEGSNLFVFRDKRSEALQNGINIHSLFFKNNFEKSFLLDPLVKSQLHKLCHCENFYRVRLNGSLHQHIVERKKLEIIGRQLL